MQIFATLLFAAALTVFPQHPGLSAGEQTIRVRIDGPVTTPLRLRFSMYVDRVEAAIPLRGGGVAREAAGTNVPFAQRSLHAITPLLPLPQDMRVPATITLQVYAEDERFAEPTLETNYPENPPDVAYVFYTLTIGLLLGIALYHLMLFAALRDRYIALYIVYLCAFMFYELVASGLAWQVLWPFASVPGLAALRFSSMIVALGVYVFAANFMQTRRNAPTAHYVFTVAVAATVLATLIGLIFPSTIAVMAIVADLGLLFGIFSCTATAIICVRRGVRAARFFLIGFAGLFVGGIMKIVGDDIGSLNSLAHFYGVETGVSFDAVILALGLADRMRTTVRERERAQALAAQHERSALTDSLTGVPNRRCFDERLRSEWNRAARSGECLALVMIDVDRFKPYNDTAGHLEGDACLRLIAQSASSCLRRAGEVFARYGGEEFAAILPNCPLDAAMATGERIAATIRELQIEHPAGGHVTVSVGVASRSAFRPEDLELLIQDADGALYQAKHSGGDCAFCAQPVA